MKKGLILALTMVALVAMALPAGAIAPVIEDLPSVIIGDSGDVSGTDAAAKHLYRYTNIMNIADSNKITWGNVDLGFDKTMKHAYYMSTDPALKAYTASTEVVPVTTADIAGIQSSGTKPAANKEITGNDFFWLTLANNLSGSANAYTATAADNGLTAAQFTPSADPATFTLVLADGDFPTTAVAQADFSVYTVAGVEDGFSGAAVKVYGADFGTGSDGWVWKSTAGFGQPTHAAAGGSLTQQIGSDTTKTYFGTWTTGDGTVAQAVIPVDSATMSGNIFRGTFTLSSDAQNVANTPGYRLFYESEAFTHMGGISHESTAAVAGSYYAPSAAGTVDVSMYWAVPFALSEYGDTEKLATVSAGKDYRAYFLAFDIVGYESTDTGKLGLDNVNIEIIARPTSTAADSLAAWGTGGLAFNATLETSGWNIGTADIAKIGVGTASKTATAITMSACASGKTAGYQQVGPFSSATSLPAWESNKLIRTNVTIASSSINAAPTFRVLTLASKATGALQSLIWVDVFEVDIAKGLYTPTGNTAAGAVKTGAGSVMETYLYTHTAPTGTNAGVLDPQVDCYTAGPAIYTNTNTAWPAENGTLTLSKFQYENCALQ